MDYLGASTGPALASFIPANATTMPPAFLEVQLNDTKSLNAFALSVGILLEEEGNGGPSTVSIRAHLKDCLTPKD